MTSWCYSWSHGRGLTYFMPLNLWPSQHVEYLHLFPRYQYVCIMPISVLTIFSRCCLVIDGMAIRRHVDYNSSQGTFSGYVDLGSGEDSTTEAKEALVFMLVGTTSGWKAPVAYFFTAGLSSASQHKLVHHLLEELEEIGFLVCAITMDGHFVNVAMASLLGARIDAEVMVQPYFSSPNGHRVFIIFDTCHMVKLLRNALQAYSSFRSPAGRISWEYISSLHEAQLSAGVHRGTDCRINMYFSNSRKWRCVWLCKLCRHLWPKHSEPWRKLDIVALESVRPLLISLRYDYTCTLMEVERLWLLLFDKIWHHFVCTLSTCIANYLYLLYCNISVMILTSQFSSYTIDKIAVLWTVYY